jgi:hypothetical protein
MKKESFVNGIMVRMRPDSLDELIAAIEEKILTPNATFEYGIMQTIIVKLHAADRLCEAAKKSADEWWRIIHEAAKFGKPIVPQNYDLFISDQVKAISDFES